MQLLGARVMRLTATELSLAILICAQTSVFAAASVDSSAQSIKAQKQFEQAQIFLRKGDNRDAEIALRRSIAERSDVALTHYYLANTLVHLQRHDEAIEEFKRSYKLDPYGLTSGYCRKALDTYGRRAVSDDAPIATDGELNAVAAIKHYNQNSKIGSQQDSTKLAAIKLQAEREKQRHQQLAESFVQSANVAGEVEAREIRNRAREEVENIMNNPRSRYPSERAMDAERVTAVRKNAEEMEVIVHDRTARRSQQYRDWSRAKGDLLDETVSNIQNQISAKNLPGSAKLNEFGTDLFVRNYGHEAVHPASVRVNSDNSGSQNNPASVVVGDDQGESATPQNNPLPITQRTVRGQLIPPM